MINIQSEDKFKYSKLQLINETLQHNTHTHTHIHTYVRTLSFCVRVGVIEMVGGVEGAGFGLSEGEADESLIPFA